MTEYIFKFMIASELFLAKEIIAKYKDAGRKSFLRKNPKLLVDYENLRADLKKRFQQSSLDKLKQFTGISN